MILAIGGALRPTSATAALLVALKEAVGDNLKIFDDLRNVPPFDEGSAGPTVEALRRSIAEGEGVIFATPEYAYGPPGVLKNALDWLVGSGELHGKPAAVVSASSSAGGGVRAQLQLIQTLTALNVQLIDSVAVPAVRTKLDADGRLVDSVTRARLIDLYDRLSAAVTR